ncbi:MAG: hypothetical protein RJQ07_00345 [Pseudomonadales bacterium]
MLSTAQSSLLALGLLLVLLSPVTHSISAEKPIQGGLGVVFDEPLDAAKLGSELDMPEIAITPDNRSVAEEIDPIPGHTRPWRYFLSPSTPRPLRKYTGTTYVMLDEEQKVMRVVATYQYSGCGDEVKWLTDTISKKYQVKTDMAVAPPSGSDQAYRAKFLDKQIDIRCGKKLVLDYADYRAIAAWHEREAARERTYKRELAARKKHQIVLERRRALRFADLFTLGDRFQLAGAFGVQFREPFARNSVQKFPVDTPFVAVLPGLPEEFADGEIILEISPERMPIVIRGQFNSVPFDKLAKALRAKYGTPLKASSRHIIHKVGKDHVIIKKLSAELVELAFIDTTAQAEQRNRLWEQESEGV